MNWHTGEIRRRVLSSDRLEAQLDSPTLRASSDAPYVSYKGHTAVYHRGSVRRTLTTTCSYCSFLVQGWRVVWEVPTSGVDGYLRVANVRTGKAADLDFGQFPGGTPDQPDASWTATKNQLVVSMTPAPDFQNPPPGAGVWTISAMPWPV